MEDFLKSNLEVFGKTADHPETPIYYGTKEEAMTNNEMADFVKSARAGTTCRDMIIEACSNNHDYPYFHADQALQDVAEHFGTERIKLVLANTLQNGHDWDERIDRRNFQWAKGIEVPESMKGDRHDFYGTVHSVFVNAIVNSFREHEKELESKTADKPKEKAESEVKDTAPKVKKKHHDEMER